MENITSIETHSMLAWPALVTRCYDGWVLRFSNGYTRRANSINPVHGSTLELDEKLQLCERFFRKAKLPLNFKMTDCVYPPDLDAQLEARDYVISEPVSVQTLDLNAQHWNHDPQIQTDMHPTSAWMSTFITLNSIDPALVETLHIMLAQIPFAAAYFTLRQDEKPIAVGRAASDGKIASIYGIVTDPAFRRQGFGRRLTETMLAWAKSTDASCGMLQVVSENEAAVNLYKDLGFREAYGYWYRLHPDDARRDIAAC